MVELCFNQSAQGALKMAQHCGGKGRHSVGTVFCTSEDGEKPPRRAVRAQMREGAGRAGPAGQVCRPPGEQKPDVLCLGLALSLGDIAAPLAEDGPRRALFRQFHTDFPLDGGRRSGRRGRRGLEGGSGRCGGAEGPGRYRGGGAHLGGRHPGRGLRPAPRGRPPGRAGRQVTLVSPAPVVGAAGRRGGALGAGLGRGTPLRSSACIWAGAEELTCPKLRMLALEWERLEGGERPSLGRWSTAG